MAKKSLWNTGWEFLELPVENSNYEIPESGDWKQIDIPHDWMIYDTHALYRDSIGWYQKKFTMQNIPKEDEFLLRFDGIYMDSTIYVNGQKACEWKYGYSTFEVDITPYLQLGENVVDVRVVYQSLNTRWYSGAGIYRNVWWKVRDKKHIVSDGVYITPVKRENNIWNVEIDTEVVFNKNLQLSQTILDKKGKKIASEVMEIEPAKEMQGAESGSRIFPQTISVENPDIWDIGQGNLYTLQTELYEDGKLLETETERFGFRTFSFTTDKGFFINGRHVRINGACEHHDFGCLGAAFNKKAMIRKFNKLREMGVNAIRTSHNMPAPELMDLADEMGFLVDSEAFDMWEQSKTPYDYARFFKEWYKKDVASWIRRDRNHVSLLMWSIGNEIPDTVVDAHGQDITKYLKEAVLENDPKHHAPITIGSNFMKWENGQACAELVDCAGYNYSEYLYDEHHAKNPHWVIYGSETASVLASRGIYHFPKAKHVLTDDDEQCSALGNSISGWGAKSYEACIYDDRDTEFSLGQFIWTGFDYIGESTPYETKNSYFGQLDTAGFPKDSYYIFQAEWTDYKEKPMIHLFPYWDFNPGQLVDVQVCSNAPEIELFVNGVSQGKRTIDHKKGKELVPCFKVPYVKGQIEAVAYDENHQIIAKETRFSFEDARSICAKAEQTVVKADGCDLAFVEISTIDAQGHPVENANNRIQVEVTGQGRLLGLDNGDSADFDQYKGTSKRLFAGKLLAVIGTTMEAGEIIVKITSPGLKEAQLTIQSIPAEVVQGTCAGESNHTYPIYTGGSRGALLTNEKEIPIRKIELAVEGKQTLDAVNPSVLINAKTYPADATYHELEWKAITDSGIEVIFVDISNTDHGIQVTAKGDGKFRLRCIARNGGSVASVQSNMEFEAIGLGAATFNPYEEIPAGLCSYRAGNVGEGLEHGIGFQGMEDGGTEAVIGFENVDFGSYGTNRLRLPVFANTNDPVQIRIWEGMPEKEGSVLLIDQPYHKKPEWMVFKDETYILPKRLKGISSLYIVTPDAFQLRGILCEKLDKAFEKLYAVECDRIYGDSFEKKAETVENIGNNVTLEFEDMDFGTEGTKQITLYCSTPLSVNPVQLRFTGNEGSSIQVLEVKQSSEYGEQSFQIEPLKGNGKVEFIFLPGSKFNFMWFQFK